MAKKQHVLLNNRVEEPIAFRYRPRKMDPPSDDEDKDYTQMAQRLEENVQRFAVDQTARATERTLNVPGHIDFIEIRFQDQFDVNRYTRSYLRDFGLDAVRFYEYNRRVLFAIADIDRFNSFIQKVQFFVRFARNAEEAPRNRVDQRVFYLHDFNFLSSTKIKQDELIEPIVRFSLIESLYSFSLINQLENALEGFLTGSNVTFRLDRNSRTLEVIGAGQDVIDDVIGNFDIIFSATSSLSSIIRPGRFQTPQREYGFSISNSDDESLPLVGVIDTGIDAATPLSTIVVGAIDASGTDPRIDNDNHGTAGAALVALGKRPYAVGYRGAFRADARLLSLKVMNTSPAPLSDHTVIEIIREAKEAYPAIKLFTLTINYVRHRNDNQMISDYAYALDKLANELGILIFISTSNNDLAVGKVSQYAVDHFRNELTNLCSPAESLNNFSIGACADNLAGGIFRGASLLREFPPLYSRRNCQDQSIYFSPKKINKHLRKPDFLQAGGDYEIHGNFMGTGDIATMELLSSNPAEGFYKHVGTSFSTPLAANLGAQLLRLYPDLRAQSVKALIVNACDADLLQLDDEVEATLMNRVIGYGVPRDESTVYSSDNSATFIVENSIKHSQIIAIPIALPDYLKRITTKSKGLLKITATLCFSFQPERDNQLAYCPIFMAFSIFRNKTLEEIKDNYDNALLRNRWSQDGYAVTKPILYSNVQKICFSIGKQDIINENGVLKIAVHCMLSRQLKATHGQARERIMQSNDFSMAVTVEEKQTKANITNRLYADIVAINKVVNIGTVDLNADLTV